MAFGVLRNKPSTFVSTLIMIGLCGQIFITPAIGANFAVLDEHNKYVSDLLSGMKWGNGEATVGNMRDLAVSFNDYQVETRLTGKLRDSLKEGGGKFFYKKKQRIRIEITKGSISVGAVVVKREDGNIEGRGGGMLKFVKMPLQEDSRMLALPSGHSVVKTDLPELLSELVARLKKGSKARVSSDTITGKYWKNPVRVVEIVEGPFDTVTDRVYLGSKNIPEEWDVFKEGVLISVTFFDNFKSNVGLDDSLFDL